MRTYVKSGKYSISKCLNCNISISRSSRSHLCRLCWIEKNKKLYKFKCKICKENITYGANLCKKHFMQTNPIFKKGKNNPNWQGGRTLIQRTISGLKKYLIWRNLILKRDNYTCQMCYKQKIYLEVHHKIPLIYIIQFYNISTTIQSLKCNLLWDINWGISLCKSCHNKVHPEKGR